MAARRPAHNTPRPHGLGAFLIRQEKRAQRLSFWVRRPPGGVGVFHTKGWWPKTSCPPSKLCLPWVSKRGIRDVPGILPGCPGPLAVFKSLCKKTSCAFFVPYLKKTIQEIHVDRRVVGWSAGRHVDCPWGGQISPWPARKVTEKSFIPVIFPP